ncbi:MAG: hypothetical protein ABL996_19085 [Micropepsaceae bacterium]
MRGRWIVACVLGEALGIAAVATTYAAIDRGLLQPEALWVLAAGAWEGLCLGGAQALILSSVGVRAWLWIALTVLGAVAGYALSLFAGAGADGAASSGEPPLALLLALGAALGAAMGVMMGAVQWLAARNKIALMRWILANGVGWMPAMAVIMLAATSVERVWPLYVITFIGAIAGALAGLFVGAATSFALPRIMRAHA